MKLVSKFDEQLVKVVANVIYDTISDTSSINKDDFTGSVSNCIFDMNLFPKWRMVDHFECELVAYGVVLATVFYHYPNWRVEYHDGEMSCFCYTTLHEAKLAAETRIFQQ